MKQEQTEFVWLLTDYDLTPDNRAVYLPFGQNVYTSYEKARKVLDELHAEYQLDGYKVDDITREEKFESISLIYEEDGIKEEKNIGIVKFELE